MPQPTQVGGLNLTVTSNPGARVSVSLGGRDVPVSAENGAFALQEALPEGRYTLVVRAAHPEQTLELTRSLVIDRTPPVISVSMVSKGGAILTITGAVSDNFAALQLLRAEVGGQVYALHASGLFSWTLPAVLKADMVSGAEQQLKTLTLSATDEAGNRTDALLP